MIKIKIKVNKIDKARLFKGKSDTYLDAVLIERPDDYGNDGFIAQDVTKEEREAGEKGEIIGSFKVLGGKKPAPQQRKAPPARRPDPDLDVPEDGNSIPF